MKQIPLTQGKFAIVDDEDFDWLSQWNWFLSNGYAKRWGSRRLFIPRKMILMHREILNTPSGMETDHVNGNRLDNRRGNLRICNHSENQCNHPAQIDNSSGYKGVSWHCTSWRAVIHINGKQIHLGSFSTAEDAARTYDRAAREYFGKFANTNFSD